MNLSYHKLIAHFFLLLKAMNCVKADVQLFSGELFIPTELSHDMSQDLKTWVSESI